MATKDTHPAIRAMEDEIAAIEKQQEPTRKQIAELEAQLVEGQQIIARNRAAIDVLNGNVALGTTATPTRRRRSSSGGVTASQIDERRIIDTVAANGWTKANVIAEAVGVSGNPLSLKLRAMVEDGKLKRRGERRATEYALPTED